MAAASFQFIVYRFQAMFEIQKDPDGDQDKEQNDQYRYIIKFGS